MASTDKGGIGGGRFGSDKTTGYKKPTGALTSAQRSNQSRSNSYPLNNYEADFRFRQEGMNRGQTSKPGGGFQFPGGFGGGGRRGSSFAEEDFEYQKELDRLVWERSTPDVTGVGGTWIQTSYNSSFRKNYAYTGDTYDAVKDAFIPVKPHPSCVFNEDTCRWETPLIEGQE